VETKATVIWTAVGFLWQSEIWRQQIHYHCGD